MNLHTEKLQTRTWAQAMAERVRFALDIANDEYDAPIKKEFRYSINTDLANFLADLKRLEAIRRQLLQSEMVRDPSPPERLRRWPFRVTNQGLGNHVWPKLTFQDETLDLLNDEGRRITLGLNRFLARFVTFPRLYCHLLMPISVGRKWTGSEERILGVGVEEILEAFHNRSFDRIRICREPNCKRWFFAITEHQQYCATACRIRDVAKSPSFKEKRARYMRERYRPQVKELEERAKKLAARKRR